MDERIVMALVAGLAAVVLLVYFVWSIRRLRRRNQWKPPKSGC